MSDSGCDSHFVYFNIFVASAFARQLESNRQLGKIVLIAL
jgi:hypothetical protein